MSNLVKVYDKTGKMFEVTPLNARDMTQHLGFTATPPTIVKEALVASEPEVAAEPVVEPEGATEPVVETVVEPKGTTEPVVETAEVKKTGRGRKPKTVQDSE